MRSGVAETDRVKIEGRQSLHRRKMAKNNTPLLNGDDGNLGNYAAEEESMVRQVNLAAAYHDHISCTKSADLCAKMSDGKEGRANLPCETDHIYANCSETKNKAHNFIVASVPSNIKDLTSENKRFRDMCLVQLELIKQLQEENVKKDRQLMSLKQEVETLKVRLERRDRRMCLLRKRYTKSDDDSTSDIGSMLSDSNASAAVVPSPTNERTVNNNAPVHLVTRYFGRRSKTIPLRALKRRYLGPPKSLPKNSTEKSVSSAASMSSASETHDEEPSKMPEAVNTTKISTPTDKAPDTDVKKSHKKRGIRPKSFTSKDGFLTTDKPYFLPDNRVSPNSPVNSENFIDVPSWKLKPVTSFYQMEGTENINDPVYQRRHSKCELDERRRKRWDIQRLREQKASEKLRFKQCREAGGDPGGLRKTESFYPDASNIEFIEVTDSLPVLAFGHPIPLFQPSEFSLNWDIGESNATEPSDSPTKTKKRRISSSAPKVT